MIIYNIIVCKMQWIELESYVLYACDFYNSFRLSSVYSIACNIRVLCAVITVYSQPTITISPSDGIIPAGTDHSITCAVDPPSTEVAHWQSLI